MGGSSSSSRASTSQTDNRRVLGEGAISAENSNVTIQTLDGSVVNRALDTADFSVGKALGFADSTQDRAFDFGQNAFSAAGNSEARAYSFASAAGARALDSLNDTTTLVKDAYADAKGRGAMTDQIMIGALVMAGLVAFAAVRK